MASHDKQVKTAATTGIYLIVIAAIAVMANVLTAGAYDRVGRIDVTNTKRFTLSEGSGRLVKELALEGGMTVDAYFTRTGLASQEVVIEDLVALLKAYENASDGKFSFTLINPDTEDLRDQAKEEGLQELQFGQAGVDDSAQFAKGFAGLVFKYGSQKDVMPNISNFSFGQEFFITNKIRELRDKAEDLTHKIGVITGKDELKLTDSNLVPKRGQGGPTLQGILNQYFPFYEIVEVDLKEGEEDIDKELTGLIITQPGKEYTEKELRKIDDFLMLGNKSLAVFASAATLKPNDPSMEATLDLHGLDTLLAGYGINIQKNVVLDFGASLGILVMTQGGPAQIRHPGIAQVSHDPRFDDDEQPLDNSFAAFFRLPELAFPFPSSLELLPDKQPQAEIRAVARTTPAAVAVTEETVNMKPRAKWDSYLKPAEGSEEPPFAQHIIGAVSEGKLKSAFGEGEDAKQAPEPSRVLVISSSEFLTNPFTYAGNGPEMGGQFAMMGNVGGDQELVAIGGMYAQRYLEGMILSVKNTFDWLTGDTDLLATSAKISGAPNLKYTSVEPPKISPEDTEETLARKDEEYRTQRKSIQTAITWSLTLGIPILFALLGIGRMITRQSRREKFAI